MLRMLFVLCALSSVHAYAEDLSIIDVRRNITLADDEAVYKDFYISTDGGSGLKKNLVVTAMRKISIRDASGSQAYGEILVPVGQLKVIAIYSKIAVAREYKLLSREDLPMLEQIGIMTGDKIDLQGSFVDTSKPQPKRKVSENTPAPAAIAVAILSTTPAAAVAPAMPSPMAAAPSPVTTTSATPAALAPTPQVASKTPPAPSKGPAPASVPPAMVAEPVPSTQKLEKSADSGNNTAL